ncbi:condensation domain-containing protein [Streptomyces sp. enrichment culture]|uniref:condensation domain-containing protein n=1 Tax=Streptomyces sp. enrichment culture TaxID=1795815 RepID=UPI003F557B26
MTDQISTDALEDKRRRLARLLAERGRDEETRTGPVSFAQRRLWILDRLVPGSCAYNIPIVLRTPTAPDGRALARALARVVRRHEVLRTVFPAPDGMPVQQVQPPFEPAVEAVDVSTAGDPAAAAEDCVRQWSGQPFDLATGPLLRVMTVRVSADEHLIALCVHHIVCDGWSVGTLFRELDAYYHEFTGGRAASLPELPQQYIDYAIWQRGRLTGEREKELTAYWRERLSGAPGILQLPMDRARPTGHRVNGGNEEFEFSEDLARAVHDFALRERTTPFTVLLTCFSALMGRYSGQEDVLLGVPVAGQSHQELEGLIGFFVNTLVVRSDLTGAPTLREAVGRAKDAVLGAFAHQDMPFEKLVIDFQPDRNPTVSPVFQVLFNYQTAGDERVRLPHLGADLVPFDSGIVRFDLELNLYAHERRLGGSWVYNAELFDSAVMHRMSRTFGRLLTRALAEPDRPLGEIPLLDEADLAELARLAAPATDAVEPAVRAEEVLDAGADVRAVLDALATDAPGAGAITELRIRPGLLHQFVAAIEDGAAVRAPRRIVCSGEPLPLTLERRCLAALPATELHTRYTSPAAGEIAGRRCAGDVPAGHDIAGRPLAGRRVRVLDDHGNPVPVGVPGRVHVSGPATDGGPEIDTGDLGRFREDGALEILGRRDEQVHLKQVRVPRAEIEAVLLTHEGVGDARVDARLDDTGNLVLVAYLVPHRPHRPGSEETGRLCEELRAHCQRLLPEVLLPTSYVVLEAFPLTPDGRVDRAALPAPAAERPGAAPVHTEPSTPLEETLAGIWRSVLGLPSVGVHDNFFLLGGHSLLAVQVMSRLRRATGVDLPVSVLFRYRTIADLAVRIGSLGAGAQERPGALARIQSGTAAPALALVHPAGGSVFCYASLATALTNRTVYAFEGGQEAPSHEARAAAYLAELEAADPGPYLLGGWSLGGTLAFEMARRLHARGQDPGPVVLIDSFLYDGDPDSPDTHAYLLHSFLRDLTADLGMPVPALPPGSELLTVRRLFADVLDGWGDAVPAGLDLDEVVRRYGIYRDNMLGLAAYRPTGPRYPGEVHLVQAERSPEAVEGWRAVAENIVVHRVPGDHYSIMRNPELTRVARILDGVLGAAGRMTEEAHRR